MSGEGRVELAGSARQVAERASPSGEVDPNERVDVSVVLRRRTPLEPLAAYGFARTGADRRVTRAAFGRQHGAYPKDVELVRAFAREYDLTMRERSPELRSVALSGTVAAMQRAFGTALRRYASPRGTYRGRTGPLTVPRSLSQAVVAVLGLDNRPVALPHLRLAPAAAPSGLTPLQVAGLYGFPSQLDGAGQTIGIIELGGGFAGADLTTYFGQLGLQVPSVKAVPVDGGSNAPGVDPNSDGEVMLDIEVAGAVAPGAGIVVYFTPNTDAGFVDAISTAVHDATNRPSVISISWGGPEESWTPQSANAMLEALSDAAAVGVTVTVAAGDSGATDGVQDDKLHVDLPACLPPVLACGGTRLNASGSSIASEVVWNELATGNGATGGGVSKLFALPSYQTAAHVPLQPETNFAGRGVPDVSGNADPLTGYRVRVDGKDMVIGGTSAVAPLWAALVARLNQGIGKSLGALQPALYQAGETPFRDITSGNNGYWKAGPGWDACTGLGSPNGSALLKALQAPAA